MRVIIILSSLFLASCGFDLSSIHFPVLDPAGEIAAQEKHLLIVALGLMFIIIIPVFIMIPVFAWKYRAGNKKANYMPNWHHNNLLEIIWWTIPCIIVAILATITWVSTHKLDPYRPLDHKATPISIQVVALDWKWLFIYPELNIATVNFIQFPVNVPLNFEITADAPMNSFAIPQLGGQIYAMQGMTTKLHLIADRTGEFKGYSSNYSGSGFSGMKFIAKATSQEDFELWIKKVQSENTALTYDLYGTLVKQSENDPVRYFSSVENDLYDHVLGKFMMHGMSYDSTLDENNN